MFSQGTFINDPNATPSELERKREAIRAMLGQYGKARYVGEGIADMFTGIANGIGSARLNKQEREAREQATNQYEDVLGGWNPFGGNISTSGTQTHGAGGAFGDPYGARNTAMAANGGPTNAAADAMGIRQGLIDRGLPEHIADGFIMNFEDESGLNPGINEQAPLVPGSRGGFGLAQWTGPRRRALEQFAAQRGTPVSDVNTQLDFLMTELQGPESRAAAKIMAANDAGSAGAAIVNEFLRPAEEHRARRVAEYTGGGGAVSTQGSAGGYPAYTGPAVQDLAQLMANPWLTPEQRSVVAMQLQQAQQASDPMRQIQWQQAQQQMALNDEKLRQMRNPKTVRTLSAEEAGQLGLPAGGVYQMDPEGNISTAAAAPKPSSVADQYRVVGNTLYDLGAEGGPKPVGEGQGQEMVVYGPNGEPIMVQGPTGSSAKFTEGQSKDNVYSTRARGALEVLDPLAETLTSRVDRGAEMVPFGLARGVQSDDYQVAQQAGTEFLQAILRKDTGAAITTDETESYGRVYLPQPGDGPAVLEAKRQARIRAVNAIESGMNPSQMLARDRALLKSEIEAGTYEPGNATPSAADQISNIPDFGGMSDEELDRWIEQNG